MVFKITRARKAPEKKIPKKDALGYRFDAKTERWVKK